MSFWSDYQHFCTKITTKKSKQRWILRKTVFFFFFFFSTSGILGFVFGSYYLWCKRKRACLIVKYHVKKVFLDFPALVYFSLYSSLYKCLQQHTFFKGSAWFLLMNVSLLFKTRASIWTFSDAWTWTWRAEWPTLDCRWLKNKTYLLLC